MWIKYDFFYLSKSIISYKVFLVRELKFFEILSIFIYSITTTSKDMLAFTNIKKKMLLVLIWKPNCSGP